MNYNNLTLEQLIFESYMHGKEFHINDGNVVAMTDKDIDIPDWLDEKLNMNSF